MLSTIIVDTYVLTLLLLRGGGQDASGCPPSLRLTWARKKARCRLWISAKASPSSKKASPRCTGGTWRSSGGHLGACEGRKSESESAQSAIRLCGSLLYGWSVESINMRVK